jgi:hypothetical protein
MRIDRTINSSIQRLGSIIADVLPFLTHNGRIAAWSMRSVMETGY